MPQLGSFRARAWLAPLVCAAAFVVVCSLSPRHGACRLALHAATPTPRRSAPPQWWKSIKRTPCSCPARVTRWRVSTAISTATGPPDQGPRRCRKRLSRPAKEGRRRDSFPASIRMCRYKKMKAAVGLGPNEQIRAASLCRRRSAVPRKEVQSGGREIPGRHRPRSPLGDRARRDVHARRKLLLRRPLHQSPRRLRCAGQGTCQHAVHGHASSTTSGRSPTIGKNRTSIATTGRSRRMRSTKRGLGSIRSATRSKRTTASGSTIRPARGPTMRSWPRRTSTSAAANTRTPTTTTRCFAKSIRAASCNSRPTLLGLQAKLRKYQGENYDGTPLEEAKCS